ncbi:MAG: SDR family NAD(P)-dependent oxidoreductase [Pseudomonadota bacterium]|nr:SDR family NAD(P)-dependent oxidoreductase [Pseudomonadota bacterium]
MKNFKSVLITGGAQRIGESIAKFLGKSGYNVAIQFNRSSKKALLLKEYFDELDVRFKAFKFNLEKSKEIDQFYNNLIRDFGKIDILINNASTFNFDTVTNSNQKIFDKHINVNLKAPFFLSHNFVKYLGKQNGLIINLIDQRVKNITPYFTSYTLSKSALYTLTKSLSLFLAPKIRVNGISPGPTLISKNQNQNQFKRQILRTPLRKKVDLSEINSAVDYLIKNNSVTGEVLTIDSGQSLGWTHSKSKVYKSD